MTRPVTNQEEDTQTMTSDPYKELCPVDLAAPADMLEIVAGYENPNRSAAELAFAFSQATRDQATLNDTLDAPDDLRWIACLISRRLADIGGDRECSLTSP